MFGKYIIWRSTLSFNKLETLIDFCLWIKYRILPFALISPFLALLISIKISCGTELTELESFPFIHMLLGGVLFRVVLLGQLAVVVGLVDSCDDFSKGRRHRSIEGRVRFTAWGQVLLL